MQVNSLLHKDFSVLFGITKPEKYPESKCIWHKGFKFAFDTGKDFLHYHTKLTYNVSQKRCSIGVRIICSKLFETCK